MMMVDVEALELMCEFRATESFACPHCDLCHACGREVSRCDKCKEMWHTGYDGGCALCDKCDNCRIPAECKYCREDDERRAKERMGVAPND